MNSLIKDAFNFLSKLHKSIALIDELQRFHLLSLVESNFKDHKETANHVMDVIDSPTLVYSDCLKSKLVGFLSGK